MELLQYLEAIGGAVGFIGLCGLLVFAALQVWFAVSGRNRREDGPEGELGEVCRGCGYDLRASETHCPECGANMAEMRAQAAKSELDPHALRDDWPVQEIAPRKPDVHEIPVTVHETTNSLEANLLVAQLQARGVQAGIQLREETQWAGRAYANRVFQLVRVPSEDEELARSIIDRFRWNREGQRLSPAPEA